MSPAPVGEPSLEANRLSLSQLSCSLSHRDEGWFTGTRGHEEGLNAWRRNTFIQRGNPKSSAGSPGGDLGMPGPGVLCSTIRACRTSPVMGSTSAQHETLDPVVQHHPAALGASVVTLVCSGGTETQGFFPGFMGFLCKAQAGLAPEPTQGWMHHPLPADSSAATHKGFPVLISLQTSTPLLNHRENMTPS